MLRQDTGKQMRTWGRVALCLLGLVCLSGCSYDPSDPAYDTAANPKGFPVKAIALLDGIESGELARYEQITDAFGDLYTTHPVLLGDPDWSEIIERLGPRLEYRADLLVQDGLLQFGQAADYYALAAQIDGSDTALGEKARLFGTWRQALDDSLLDINQLLPDNRDPADAVYRISSLLQYALVDSLHFLFSREYLARELTRAVEPPALDTLVPLARPDRALLAALQVRDMPPDSVVASFGEGAVELLSYRLVTEDSDTTCRFEAYFYVHESLLSDYTIALRIESPDTLLSAARQPEFPFDFAPARSTTQWQPGDVALALHRFPFAFPISAVSIGLYTQDPSGPTYLTPAGRSAETVRIPISSSGEGN